MAGPQDGQGFGNRCYILSGIYQALGAIVAFPSTSGESWAGNCLLALCVWMYMYVCKGEADKDRLKCTRHLNTSSPQDLSYLYYLWTNLMIL